MPAVFAPFFEEIRFRPNQDWRGDAGLTCACPSLVSPPRERVAPFDPGLSSPKTRSIGGERCSPDTLEGVRLWASLTWGSPGSAVGGLGPPESRNLDTEVAEDVKDAHKAEQA